MNKSLSSALLSLSLCLSTPLLAKIELNKSFSPNSVNPDRISKVTINLSNFNNEDATKAQFTDTLPKAIKLATPLNAISTCGGTITANLTADGYAVSLVNGRIPKSPDQTTPGTCRVTFDVIAPRLSHGETTKSYENIIKSGELTADLNGTEQSNTDSASGTLTVNVASVDVNKYFLYKGSKQFAINLYPGDEVELVVKLKNNNKTKVTGVRLQDVLSPLVKAVSGTSKTTCSGGSTTVQTVKNSNNVDVDALLLSSATIPAEGECEFSVQIEQNDSKYSKKKYYSFVFNNKIGIGELTSDQGATNSEEASALIFIRSGVTVSKSFSLDLTPGNGDFSKEKTLNLAAKPDGVVRLKLSYTTYNHSPAPNNFKIVDNLPAGMVVADTPNPTIKPLYQGNDCSTFNVSSAVPGATSFTMSGDLPQKEKNSGSNKGCHVEINVKVSKVGTYVNNLGVKSDGGNKTDVGNGFSVPVYHSILDVVTKGVKITKTFSLSNNPTSHPSGYQGDTLDLTFTFTNFSQLSINNLALVDELNKMQIARDKSENINPIMIDATRSIINHCNHTADLGTYRTGDVRLAFTKLYIAPKSSCTVIVPLVIDTEAIRGWRQNTIETGNITYNAGNSATAVSYPEQVRARVYVNNAITLRKAFKPSPINLGGKSRLALTIQHNSYDGNPLKDVGLIDELPSGMTVANPANTYSDCGGTVTAVPGQAKVSLAGGTITVNTSRPTKGQCTFYVDVQTQTQNSMQKRYYVNNILGDVIQGNRPFSATMNGGPLQGDQMIQRHGIQAMLTAENKIGTISKVFSLETLNSGSPSRVTIKINNSHAGAIDLTGVELTDNLRLETSSRLELHSYIDPRFTDENGQPDSNGCAGGIFVGKPKDTQITLKDASIKAGATCLFSFNVTSVIGGTFINKIAKNSLKNDQNVTNPNDISESITFGGVLSITKSFDKPIIQEKGRSKLTVTVYNSQNVDEQGLSWSDTMPAGVKLLSTPSPITNCTGGSTGGQVTVDTTSNELKVEQAAIKAKSNCSVTVTVQADATGAYTNTIPKETVKTQQGTTNPDEAVAVLRVVKPPEVKKSFLPSTILEGGTSKLVITVINPNALAILPNGLSGVSLTDTLTDMTVANPVNFNSRVTASTCTDVQHNLSAGATNLTFSNIRIPSNAAGNAYCEFSFDIKPSKVGTLPNQTSGATSNETPIVGSKSNIANLTVLQPLTIKKSFTAKSTTANTPETMSLEITNPNRLGSGIAIKELIDTFPSGMKVADPVNLVMGCKGTRLRNTHQKPLIAGDTSLYLSGGSISPGKTCSIKLSVIFSTIGSVTNKTETIYSTYSGVTAAGNQGSATIQVTAPNSLIGLVKSAGKPKENADGTHSVEMIVKVKNLGFDQLKGVRITDDLTAQFGNYANPIKEQAQYKVDNVTIKNAKGANLSLTPKYNGAGQAELATGVLEVGAESTITLGMTFKPKKGKSIYSNQAQGTATGEISNKSVTDFSNDGDEYDSNNNGITNEKIDNTPSLVKIRFGNSLIGLVKSAGKPKENADGTHSVEMIVKVKNLGFDQLKGVRITDDLTAQFGNYANPIKEQAQYKVDNVTIENAKGANLSLTPKYNGAGQAELATGVLEVGAESTITLGMTFKPKKGKSIYSNQAKGTATGEISNKSVTDFSNDGDEYDSNNNGITNEKIDNTPSLVKIRLQTEAPKKIPVISYWSMLLMLLLMLCLARRNQKLN